jgi:hypothetical protein
MPYYYDNRVIPVWQIVFKTLDKGKYAPVAYVRDRVLELGDIWN